MKLVRVLSLIAVIVGIFLVINMVAVFGWFIVLIACLVTVFCYFIYEIYPYLTKNRS